MEINGGKKGAREKDIEIERVEWRRIGPLVRICSLFFFPLVWSYVGHFFLSFFFVLLFPPQLFFRVGDICKTDKGVGPLSLAFKPRPKCCSTPADRRREREREGDE